MNTLSNYSMIALSYGPNMASVHKQVWRYI